MKTKNIIIATVFLMSSISYSYAEKVKIVLLKNCEFIIVDKDQLSTGDIFDETQTITWPNDSAYIKIRGIETGKQERICALEMKRTKTKSLSSYFETKSLSSHGIGLLDNCHITDTLFLMDTLLVYAGIDYGNKLTNKLSWNLDGKPYETPISKTSDGKSFIISRDYFDFKCGKMIEADIFETDTSTNWTYCKFKRLLIVVLPDYFSD